MTQELSMLRQKILDLYGFYPKEELWVIDPAPGVVPEISDWVFVPPGAYSPVKVENTYLSWGCIFNERTGWCYVPAQSVLGLRILEDQGATLDKYVDRRDWDQEAADAADDAEMGR